MEDIKLLASAYLIIINLVGFFISLDDKNAARKGRWRIPERTLFLISLIGGSVGMYISMRIFHHKTKHKRFMTGIPLIIAAQAAAAYFFIRRYCL